jgi:hypothetical protein
MSISSVKKIISKIQHNDIFKEVIQTYDAKALQQDISSGYINKHLAYELLLSPYDDRVSFNFTTKPTLMAQNSNGMNKQINLIYSLNKNLYGENNSPQFFTPLYLLRDKNLFHQGNISYTVLTQMYTLKPLFY